MKVADAPPPRRTELVRAQDRMSFVYLERCIVHRDSNASSGWCQLCGANYKDETGL
jgi:hypothetical protein